MLKRPGCFAALGPEVTIETLDQANLVLHELAWVQQQLGKVAADVKIKIDALKAAAPPSVKIKDPARSIAEDPVEVSLLDRQELLQQTLATWTAEHIAEHLTGKKRSIDLPHGRLGLRQRPQIVEMAEGWAESAVLAAIDEIAGVVAAVTGILDRKTGIGSARVRDLLDIQINVSCKAARDAIEAQRVTAAELEPLGLVIREAYDEPVVTPTKTVVLAD